jgi:hypothetical protein
VSVLSVIVHVRYSTADGQIHRQSTIASPESRNRCSYLDECSVERGPPEERQDPRRRGHRPGHRAGDFRIAAAFGDTALITTTPGTARSAHIVALQAINETYRTAVASARATFAVDSTKASTRAERATVRAELELAIVYAAVARAAAMATLGPPPAKNTTTTL